MVRAYKDSNKASWIKATVSRQLGPRSYYCILSHNNREIKRHLNQMRDRESPEIITEEQGSQVESDRTSETGHEKEEVSFALTTNDRQ